MQGHLDIGISFVYALLGYLVVFIGLVLLMLVVMIMGRIMVARMRKAAPAAAPAPAAPAPAAPAAPRPLAPGSAGELKLYDTDPRDAALIMAIVADKMGRPLNELRFKSIKEVK